MDIIDTRFENYLQIFANQTDYFRDWSNICFRQVNFPFEVIKIMNEIDRR